MRPGSVLLIVALLAGGGCSLHRSPASTVPSEWAAVQALPATSRIRVVTRSGESVVGTLAVADNEEIRIVRRGATGSFKRRDITRVFQQGARKTAKYRRNGALIGLAAGALVMVSDGGLFGMLLAGYWAGLGAGLGAASGYATREETLIYAAPQPLP